VLDHFQYDDLVARGFEAEPELNELDEVLDVLVSELAVQDDDPVIPDALRTFGRLCFMAGRSFQADQQPLAVDQAMVEFSIPAGTAGRLLEALLGD
jgi:hypothetical protein